MSDLPTRSTVAAWTGLLRASRRLTAAIEADIRAAGLPPIPWYEVLLELSGAPDGRLTPRQLEAATLLAQYGLSRLLDRMESEGLVVRVPYPGDRRRQRVEITGAGLALRKVMWPVYAAAIERRVGRNLDGGDADALSAIAGRLAGNPL
jgi:DNA-binding MarR family transcriptional regulator